MSLRTDSGEVRSPIDSRHRRELMVDAIGTLDVAAMHELITKRHATVDDVQLAIQQTDRTYDEVMTAYTEHLEEVRVAARAADYVRLLIAQQPLFGGVS